MTVKQLIFIALFVTALSGNAAAQQMCSDAGTCIIGRRNPEAYGEETHSKLTLDYNLGFSGQDGGDFTINTFTLDADFPFYKLTRFEVILPYRLSTGPIATEKGFGDMMLSFSGYIPTKKFGTIGLTIGAKIASGSSNFDGLPLAYQPGTGIDALIFGAGTELKHFSIYAAYLRSLGRSNNDNSLLKKGDDVMLRATLIQPIRKTVLQLELITIKRIQVSSVKVPLILPITYMDIDGSNELQVNVVGRVSFMLGDKFRMETAAALPLLKRDFNYDGLKRSFSASTALSYIFDMP